MIVSEYASVVADYAKEFVLGKLLFSDEILNLIMVYLKVALCNTGVGVTEMWDEGQREYFLLQLKPIFTINN